MKALLIYSGGLDSSTLLHQYKNEIFMAVSFDYGSKHNKREIKCAVANCKALNIRHEIIKLDFINKHFKSDLLKSGGEIPDGSYQDENMKKTVVPFRNGIMMSIAVGLAESNEIDTVLIGNHAGDHDIYPDCRESFIKAFAQATSAGTYQHISISSPYNSLSKRDIALIGEKIGIDYSHTYSCYKGGEVHCGTCGTCMERKEALQGFDNTIYLK